MIAMEIGVKKHRVKVSRCCCSRLEGLLPGVGFELRAADVCATCDACVVRLGVLDYTI